MNHTIVDFIDLLVLQLCVLYRSDPPTQKELYWRRDGLINEFLRDNEIDPIFAAPLTSNTQLMKSIETLRQAGLLEPEGRYEPTQAGEDVFNRIGIYNAKRWPISLPFTKDGQPIMASANYLPEI